MDRRTLEVFVERSEQLLPWLVLLLLLSYTYLELFHAPYLGFDFNPANGAIQEVYSNTTLLQPGDRLYAVQALLFTDWAATLRLPLVTDVQQGDRLAIQIIRNGVHHHIDWSVIPPTWGEILARLVNVWPLGYFFWLAGLLTFLSLRPRNSLQRLFVLFFFLTAIWIVAGNSSRRNLWEASVVFRMAIWLSVPVYLHLHWSFPRSIGKLPAWIFPLLYLAGIGLAFLQWYELLPKQSYALGFVVALFGSLAFLLIHLVRGQEERRRTAVILYSFVLSLLPSVLLSIASVLQSAPRLGGLALLALPILPAGYFYAIYRQQSGRVEIRVNRLLTLFSYLILVGTGVIAFEVVFARVATFPGSDMAATLLASLSVTLLTLRGYRSFERWIETNFLGMPHSSETVLASYLERITTSLKRSELVRLLQDEVLPSLLIRQSALFLVKGGTRWERLYSHGIDKDTLPSPSFLTKIQDKAGPRHLRPEQTRNGAHSWVRFSLPLVFGGRTIGLWLLGRHDPDDLYTGHTISILENLARQTSIALVNIQQAEELEAFFRSDIERHEAERTRLARTLHDDILNQVAHTYNSLDSSALSARFEQEYAVLKEQLRRMINNLRPATLRWGLHVALTELVDDLNDRQHGPPSFELAIPDSYIRYPSHAEEQMYSIVHQACENTLRHSQARHVQIAGTLRQDHVEIRVIDDGIGFEISAMDLSSLREQKRFGLLGIYERARLIGAEIVINSEIGHGTQVHLYWSDHSARTLPKKVPAADRAARETVR